MKALGGKRIEVAISPHFLLVMDIPSLHLLTVGGGRVFRRHELLHVYLQRAEMARREFVEVFGSAYDGRSCLVLVDSEKVRAKFAERFFGNTWTSLRRGYNQSGTIAGGRAINGIAIAGRKKDDDLHFRMRHMLGHLLMSTYLGQSPMEKYLPKWIDVGAAHWLCKRHPRAKDFAFFCLQEGQGRGRPKTGSTGARGGGGYVAGTGTRWHDKARKVAGRGPKADPVEAMFTASTMDQMNYYMHVRAWSWFDVFTREEREPFVRFVGLVRRAYEPRKAAKAAWNQAPERVDERWREFVLGRRREVEATEKEKETETEVGETTIAELAAIQRERNLQLLASLIRGLERCQNITTARVLISLIEKRDSDRVREVIALVLGRTIDEKVLAFLRGEGYERAGALGRATLCRAFGALGDSAAIPLLRRALKDPFWLARAHAARSLAQLRDPGSRDALTELATSSPKGKLRVAGMDALALFGAEARPAVAPIGRNLTHGAWQVKVAACQALARIGGEEAVDLLVPRLEVEGGRVEDEIRLALKALTGIDRRWSAKTWREWWAKARKWSELERKSKKALEEEGRGPAGGADDRYAKPEKKKTVYYGIKVFARTVGYVLDTSASMKQGFQVSERWQKALGRTYTAKTRIGVCREELAFSLRELDPRTRFNLYFFHDRARAWKTTPVPAGSMAESGAGAAKAITPAGQTNYFDALKLVLGATGGPGGWNAAFADTPDTLFFLTDGLPTVGEITKADELLSWFNERNRFARLRVHVIAMGRAGLDPELLRALAEQNGGTFLHLTGSY
jgi:hypothetical protein